ncbi:MAG: hypothetical protein ACFCUI_13835 [Bernardetiaceae bacterium]
MPRSIQDYLSLGYLYLLLLGIIRDTLYYGFVGINIMQYTGILDVLLSPLVFLASKPIVPILIVGVIVLMLQFSKLLHRKAIEQGKAPLFLGLAGTNASLAVVALIVFSMYLGAGLGGGASLKNRITDDDFTPNYVVYFANASDSVPVYLIGQNSQYIFYVSEGRGKINIAPVSGNIRKLVKSH